MLLYFMKKEDKKLNKEDLEKLEEIIKKALSNEEDSKTNFLREENKFIETMHVEKFSPTLEPIKNIKKENKINELEEVASTFVLNKKSEEEKETGYKKIEKEDKYNPMKENYFADDYRSSKDDDLVPKPIKFKTEEKKYNLSSR